MAAMMKVHFVDLDTGRVRKSLGEWAGTKKRELDRGEMAKLLKTVEASEVESAVPEGNGYKTAVLFPLKDEDMVLAAYYTVAVRELGQDGASGAKGRGSGSAPRGAAAAAATSAATAVAKAPQLEIELNVAVRYGKRGRVAGASRRLESGNAPLRELAEYKGNTRAIGDGAGGLILSLLSSQRYLHTETLSAISGLFPFCTAGSDAGMSIALELLMQCPIEPRAFVFGEGEGEGKGEGGGGEAKAKRAQMSQRFSSSLMEELLVELCDRADEEEFLSGGDLRDVKLGGGGGGGEEEEEEEEEEEVESFSSSSSSSSSSSFGGGGGGGGTTGGRGRGRGSGRGRKRRKRLVAKRRPKEKERA